MEKISHIVPASTRQVWASGENDKPRRVSEPTPEDRAKAFVSSMDHESPSASVSKAGSAGVSTGPSRGGRLNTMA